jgi:outer membrane receptor protein involved in Fe transport
MATDWLTVKGSYTLLSTEIKEGMFEGKDVPNAPRHKATMDVIYNITKEAAAALNGIYIGERPFISDFSNNFGDQEGYVILNARFTYQWKSLKAFVDINNLTNKEYSNYGVIGGVPLEKAFYPSPKRNFLAGLSMNF